MDGFLNLWDLVVEMSHSSLNESNARSNQLRDKHCETHSSAEREKQSNTLEIFGWTDVDYVTSNGNALASTLYITFLMKL